MYSSANFPRYLQLAIKIAEANDYYQRYRHGAVIVRGGSVQSVGFSKLHTAPHLVDCESQNLRSRISTHAEAEALKRCSVTKGATMYVARVGRNDKVALSKPCKNCQRLLADAGIKKIVWTVSPTEWDSMPKGV